jgi:hypothetical protein
MSRGKNWLPINQPEIESYSDGLKTPSLFSFRLMKLTQKRNHLFMSDLPIILSCSKHEFPKLKDTMKKGLLIKRCFQKQPKISFVQIKKETKSIFD